MLIPKGPLKDLVILKEKYHNDMELGKEVREYLNKNKELIEKYIEK